MKTTVPWGCRRRVGSDSGSTAVGGRGWGPAGGAPGTSSCEWVIGRPGGSGSTWQSLRTMGWGGFRKWEGTQAALPTAPWLLMQRTWGCKNSTLNTSRGTRVTLCCGRTLEMPPCRAPWGQEPIPTPGHLPQAPAA